MSSSAADFTAKHRLLTNAFCAVLCMLVADVALQVSYERRKAKRSADSAWRFNFGRSVRLVVTAGLVAMLSHQWYVLLDGLYASSGARDFLAKIVLDEIFMAPTVITTYIAAVGFLERQKLIDIKHEWNQKFTRIFMTDLAVWPSIQIINFLLVPSHFRLIFINVCSFVWNIYLSHVIHSVSHRQAHFEGYFPDDKPSWAQVEDYDDYDYNVNSRCSKDPTCKEATYSNTNI